MNMFSGTVNDYQKMIKEGKVLVDFSAEWCGPCKMLSPILEQLPKSLPDLKIIKVNIDDNYQLAQSFKVMSVPTLLLYKDGQMIDQRMGFQTLEMLIEWVNSIN